MRIKEILYRHRRDFTAIYECEHCGYTEKSGGYDDDNFHVHVIPERICVKCGKKADRATYAPLATKYQADETV